MGKNQTRILIVDDEQHLQMMLKNMLELDGYSCAVASNAAEAREHLKKEHFALMLCDQKMPGESGIDLIRYVSETYPDISVIKPYRLNELLINVSNALQRQRLEREQKRYRKDLEKMVMERTAQLQKTLSGVIQAMSLAVESRDPYTAGHQQRVGSLALSISQELGLTEEESAGLHMAGIVHDLGKLSIPAEILSKPTRLTDLEFELIKCHSDNGFQILKDIEFPRPIAQMVLEHHERMDGSGYPQGLTRNEILFESKILSVADVVEAMASHRPYRPALGLELALEEIKRNMDVKFDVDVVNACLKLFLEEKFSFEN